VLPIAPARACVVGAAAEPTFAIVGDSHAGALAAAFTEAAKRGVSAKLLSLKACPPIPGLQRAHVSRDYCSDYYEMAYNYIAQRDAITYVVLSARWALYLEGSAYDNGEGGVERQRGIPTIPTAGGNGITDAERRAAVASLYAEAVRRLLDTGKTVILVYPVPEIGWNVPEYLARALWFGRDLPRPLSVSYSHFQRRNAAVHAAFDAVGDHPNLLRIRPANIFCNGPLEGRCVAELDGAPIYSDHNHLQTNGAVLVVEEIFRTIDATALEAPVPGVPGSVAITR
jgi:hypothetical protein